MNKIIEWTANQKMILNAKKTNLMIFNFSNNYKFITRLALDVENLDVVDIAKCP